MNSKQIAILISFVLGLPLFFYTLASVDIDRVSRIASQVKPLYLLMYTGLSLLTPVTYTFIWQLFLKSYNANFSLPAITLFNFRMAEFAISYVTPGPRNGGEITSGGLISSYTEVSQKTATMAGVMETFVLVVTGLFFDTAMVVIALFLVPKSLVLQIILAVLISAILFVFIGWYGFVEKGGGRKILQWLTDLIDIPRKFSDQDSNKEPRSYAKEHVSTVIRGILWCLLTKVFIALQMYVLLFGLGVPISLLQGFLLAAAIDIAYTIPSYMGLGALEAGQSGVLSLIGGAGAASAGVVVAFITRLRDIVFSGYGLLALSYYTPGGSQKKGAKH